MSSGGSREQEAADHRARKRRILFLAGAGDRHGDHRGCRHQHGSGAGLAGIDGGPERGSFR
jgi:hypothetical protein